jgi:peptide chain release factor 1
VDRHGDFRANGTGFINRLTEHVHDAAEGLLADRDHDGVAGGQHFHAAAQTIGRAHRDGANHPVAQLLLDF